MKLDIIYENNYLVAINKPSGLLSVPDRTQSEVSLKDILQQKYKAIYTVHRLDKDTSGIIVFAKDESTHKTLSTMFEHRDVEKYYLGLVNGLLLHNTDTIDAPIMQHPLNNGTMVTNSKGKPSITDYCVLQKFTNHSWVQFKIHTGRTHQIRVHTKHIGHSIVCDDVYGDGKPFFLSAIKKKFNLAKAQDEEKPIINRLALHAYKLNFAFNSEGINLIADIPKDLRAALSQLQKNASLK